MKRLIVYDLDGTLVDTLADIAEAANHMLRTLGQPGVSSESVRGYIGSGVRDLVGRCLQTSEPRRIDQGVAIYRAYYARHFADHSRLYPGAEAVLEHFKARRQAVLTNKPNPFSTDLLKTLGVDGYFFAIVGGESDYPKKPDPTAIRALMAQADAAADDTVLIGDSLIDLHTGRNAGVLTVAVTHGFGEGDALRQDTSVPVVGNFAELLQLAQREAW